MSKEAKILKYLQTGESLSKMEAWLLFKTMSLPQIIHSLRKDGHDFTVTKKRNPNTGSHWVEYKLVTDRQGVLF